MKITCGHEGVALGDGRFAVAHWPRHAALTRLAATSPGQFFTACHARATARERDFHMEEDENERRAGSGLPCYRQQHARPLSGLHHAAAARAEGDAGPALRAVASPGGWLDLHFLAFLSEHAMMTALAAAPR